LSPRYLIMVEGVGSPVQTDAIAVLVIIEVPRRARLAPREPVKKRVGSAGDGDPARGRRRRTRAFKVGLRVRASHCEVAVC
jgi:hypothetical protein